MVAEVARDSMPGLPTGPRSELAVLDLDMKKGKDCISASRDLGYDPDSLAEIVAETTSFAGQLTAG